MEFICEHRLVARVKSFIVVVVQELRRQCQQFAVDLLHQSRSSQELAIILNHDPESPPYEDGERMKLARLELAINYKQKKVSTWQIKKTSLYLGRTNTLANSQKYT